MKTRLDDSARSSSTRQGPRVRERRYNHLHLYTFTGWIGSSDLSIERRMFEPFSPHTSAVETAFCESSAIANYEDPELESRIDGIFRLAADEGFEDGMEGRMSQSLNLFVGEHHPAGIQQLATRLNSVCMNPGIAADVVRVLGQMEHEPSRDDRAYIAECLLYSESPLARDAGAVALGDLGDERSAPALQRAIDDEPIPALKADMQVSLDELVKDTDVVRSTET